MPATKTRTRKAPTDAQREVWAAKREAKLEAAHATLAAGVESLQSGAEWQAMLATASRFHRYSLGNVILLWQQAMLRDMTITRVAGFRAWQALGRQVRKGEHGLAILAPVAGWADSEGHRVRGGRITAAEARARGLSRRIFGWTTVSVFDVSQTDGDDLPDVRPALLQGDADANLWAALVTLAEQNGRPVILDGDPGDPDLSGANGYATADDIHVRANRPAAHRVKTLVHELGHVLLGHTAPDYQYAATRDVAEVEAESVAYVVLSAIGYDAGEYSLPYVASWAGETSAEVMQETASRVLSVARDVLDALGIDQDGDDQADDQGD